MIALWADFKLDVWCGQSRALTNRAHIDPIQHRGVHSRGCNGVLEDQVEQGVGNLEVNIWTSF